MYGSFFGLKKEPFGLTPDPTVLYLTPKHRDALAGISYAILAHKGFAVLTGNAGTGKTTLLSRVVQTIPRNNVTFSVILNSTLTSAEFLEAVMMNFGLRDIPLSKAQRLHRLQTFLITEHAAGRTCVLIIDEAQKLADTVLEEVRLLSNYELPDRKLLQIVLCGQPELDQLLEKDTLWQFKQRIAVRLRIQPLSPSEITEYIRFRWTNGGGSESLPFEPAALVLLAEYSTGIPRLVNILCDNSLLLAFTDNSATVTAAHLKEAASDLRLEGGEPGRSHPAPKPPATGSTVAPGAATGTDGEMSYTVPVPLPTLFRYGPAPERKSWISRCAAKFSRTGEAVRRV